MPYDEEIDSRIRNIVTNWESTNAKKMFGGVCHLLNGNMFCGVWKDYLILRLGEDAGKRALESPYAKPFDITGRPMKGWIMVESKGFKTDKELEDWLKQAKEFVKKLAPK
ncbi:MAG: TfoX/Sxy family protein [bacterium]|nr:MAG: TfoX/Sxy family protein [bacterium]